MDPFDERDDGKIGWKEFNKEANSPFSAVQFGKAILYKKGKFIYLSSIPFHFVI